MSAETRNSPKSEAELSTVLPEDIATLYSWANLHGIKYRDFSSTRQDFRSKPRPTPVVNEAAVEAEPVEVVPVEETQIAPSELASAAPEAAVETETPASSSETEQLAATEQPVLSAEPVSRGPWEEFLNQLDAESSSASAEPVDEEVAEPATIANPTGGDVAAAPPSDSPISAPGSTPLPFLQQAVRGTVEEFTAPPARVIVAEAASSLAHAAVAPVQPAIPVANPAPQRSEAEQERSSARWYALNRIAGHLEPHAHAEPVLHAPMLAIFSLAGGVGKTGLVATLGRALAARGESVLLVDTNPYGMLHVYYGAQEPRPGVVRSFVGGGQDAAVQLLSMKSSVRFEDLPQQAARASRVLIDVATASTETLRQLARYTPQVLVPLTPDMHSLASLQALEDCFAQLEESEGRRLEPVYLLNGFEASLPLHAEIHGLLSQRLGDRLLPITLHRAPLLAEALAEGMTVMDYSPGALIAEDFASLASWARRLAAPADGALRGRRWSEQEGS